MKKANFKTNSMLFISVLFIMAILPKEAFPGRIDALLLSCMDYRLVDETERYMANRGLRDKYDHIVLAGASLGAVTDKYPAWNQAFWEHLDISAKLHAIKKVIVLDHRDCGAYKTILGEDFSKNPAKEKSIHADYMLALSKLIRIKYPELEIELHLMDLAGNVERISQ